MNEHDLYMKRALELAEAGRGFVSPNPVVGCVIVHDGKIIGEGVHKRFGDIHAEVAAVRSVKDTSLLSESTLYVTLEPCAHHGKTPPCADFIIRSGIRKVVAGTLDPNPLTAGKGIAKLKGAGVDVTVPCFEPACLESNKRFFIYQNQQRPFVTLKWAQTADGFIADAAGASKWISNPFSRVLVHRMRAREDAVMVGTETALADDPALNVREVSGRNPLRVVIDLKNRLPKTLRLFDKTQPTVCYTLSKSSRDEYLEYRQLTDKEPIIPQILRDLHARGIGSVLVEGGTRLIDGFLQEKLWDEAYVFTGPTMFRQGVSAPVLPSPDALKIFETQILEDRLTVYKNLSC